MEASAIANSYDQVPYPTYARPQTHPRHLETIARLLSLVPPSSLNCRVLELGCGDGGNLIPMALGSPECQFVGVDASGRQIDMGLECVAALGLSNVQLKHLSLERIDQGWGDFDYILCHGVFSWVPPTVQATILRLIGELLAPNGIAYVSYNTQPGWHARGAIRNMMNFHVDRYSSDSPAERIRRGRGLLDFLTRATSSQQNSYGMMLRENLDLLNQLPDAYLYHEHLEEHNQPIWFLDFSEMLSKVGLRYLAEAEFSTMFAGLGFTDEIRRELDCLAPGLLEKEQYLDFLRNRSFRQTLVCRGELRPNYDVRAARVYEMCIGSPALPKNVELDLSPGVPQDFALDNDTTLNTQLAIFKAALTVMRQAWPRLLPFQNVLRDASQLLESLGIEDDSVDPAAALAKAILTTYSSTSQPLVELSLQTPKFTCELSDQPLASPLARLQIDGSQLVANLRHESVQLSEVESFLLSQLDGQHSQKSLSELLQQRFSTHFSNNADCTEQLEGSAESALKRHLERLARYALLVN